MTPPTNQSNNEEYASVPSPLLQAWRATEVGSPPLTQLLAAGRVARRRRRTMQMAGSGAAFAAIASVGVAFAVSVGNNNVDSATRTAQIAGSSSTAPSEDASAPLNMSPALNDAFPIYPGETLPQYQERLAATAVALRECPELADFITDKDKAKFIADFMGTDPRFVGGCPDAEQLRAAFERSR